MKAMHILHISKYAYPERGGIETFVRDLTREQSRQGHRVRILAHHAVAGRPTEESCDQGVTITRCATLGVLAFSPISPAFPVQLRRLLKSCPPQIIHLHLPNPAVLFHHFFPKDIPLVIHWHADVQGAPGKRIKRLYPAYRFFEKSCLDRAAAVIATTPPYLESSETLQPWRTKCTVIPLGLDQDRYPELPGIEKASPPLIVSVGRFSYYKGYEFLVRAAILIPEAKFSIVGNGPEYTRIKNMVRDLGLSGQIELPGEIPDEELQALFQRATLLCLPSVDRGEAFGMTQLEAMRYGLPLVSTAIPGSGVGWVNQDGVTGRVVPPASAEALAEAMRELLKHPDRATVFGQAGRHRLVEHFTIARVAEALDRVYERVVG